MRVDLTVLIESSDGIESNSSVSWHNRKDGNSNVAMHKTMRTDRKTKKLFNVEFIRRDGAAIQFSHMS